MKVTHFVRTGDTAVICNREAEFEELCQYENCTRVSHMPSTLLLYHPKKQGSRLALLDRVEIWDEWICTNPEYKDYFLQNKLDNPLKLDMLFVR